MKLIIKWHHPVFDETASAIADMIYIVVGESIDVEFNSSGCDDDLYVIMGLHRTKLDEKIPKNFIAIQTEQIGSKWFTQTYIERLHLAKSIWDFSPKNVTYLMKKYSLSNTIYVPIRIPLATFTKNPWTVHEDIDILFFGAFHKRRQLFENKIRSSVRNKKIVFRYNDLFGEERENLISRSKIVLNIHYWNNASLETHRIENLCSSGKCILSERSSDEYLDGIYSDSVEFFDIDNYVEMITKMKSLLGDDSKRMSLSIRARSNCLKRQFEITNLKSY